jgi:uncharacterized membrane protein (GlpM family)
VDSLTLKLILTPTLIAAASMAGRRWGPAMSGWLVGLPLTSGPIAFFLALNQGVAFARAAAIGTLTGTISQAAFCLAYGWLAARFAWPLTVLASSLVFAGSTLVLQYLSLPLITLFLTVILVLILANCLMPRRPEVSSSAGMLPLWDIPARMAIATAFVLLLTGLAPTLGPYLTGLLTPFPLYAAILAVFAHHLRGPAPAAGVVKGLLLGLFAFATFFLVLAALIEQVGIALAFAVAIMVTAVFQGGSLWVLQRMSG